MQFTSMSIQAHYTCCEWCRAWSHIAGSTEDLYHHYSSCKISIWLELCLIGHGNLYLFPHWLKTFKQLIIWKILHSSDICSTDKSCETTINASPLSILLWELQDVWNGTILDCFYTTTTHCCLMWNNACMTKKKSHALFSLLFVSFFTLPTSDKSFGNLPSK